MSKKSFLWLELFLFFFGLPLAYLSGIFEIKRLTFLLLVTVVFLLLLIFEGKVKKVELLNFEALVWKNLKFTFLRFFAFVFASTFCVWFFIPESLFLIPKERPGLWVVILIFYPLVSAYPQELIYRLFFFHRYGKLLGEKSLIFLNALAFSILHLIYENFVAVVLTFFGGLVFASSYQKTKSLSLVALEHALYGLWIFTVGLGIFFYKVS